MIPVQEHLDSILRQVRPGAPVAVPLDQAHGLVTTADVVSAVDLPRFENSAMDGYAVRADEVSAASPEHPLLVVVNGDIRAGDTTRRQHVPGRAWRIMTGGPMPFGADAVVRVEDTDGHRSEVQIRAAVRAGESVRRAAEDVQAGDVVVRAGTRLGPAQLAVLYSIGLEEVQVHPRVRVAVLSTGDELVRPEDSVRGGQIVDSNTPMLVAAVRELGHEVVHAGHVGDDEKTVAKEIRRRVKRADAVVTTGGVSKGAYDPVKAVLSGEGSMEFTEVAMQPGKPQGFGLLGKREVPVFTLPGNPVSALVSFEVFVRPALARMAGRPFARPRVEAIVARGWSSPAGREQYARVRLTRDPLGGYAAEPAGGAGSHLLGGLAGADALAVVDADTTEVTTGSTVTVLPLRPLEDIDAVLEARADRQDEAAEDADGE